MTEACTERRVAVLAGHFRACSFGHGEGIDAQVGSGHVGTVSRPAHACIAIMQDACISEPTSSRLALFSSADPRAPLASPRRAVRIAGLCGNTANHLREGGDRVGVCSACASLPCACLGPLHIPHVPSICHSHHAHATSSASFLLVMIDLLVRPGREGDPGGSHVG